MLNHLKVIHPKDRSTDSLKILYRDVEDCVVLTDSDAFSSEVKDFISHRDKQNDIVMILGHGSPDGLYSRFDDSGEPTSFDKVLVGHQHAYHLRQVSSSKLIGIFCYADEFAKKERLHGLFSGMFISEFKEALELGIETTEEEVKIEMDKFMVRLRSLLDDQTPFSDIPDKLREMDDVKSPLTMFNYYSFYYL